MIRYCNKLACQQCKNRCTTSDQKEVDFLMGSLLFLYVTVLYFSQPIGISVFRVQHLSFYYFLHFGEELFHKEVNGFL